MMKDKDLANFQIESYQLFKKYGLTEPKNNEIREKILITMLVSPILNNKKLSLQEQANTILEIVRFIENIAIESNVKFLIDKKEANQKK